MYEGKYDAEYEPYVELIARIYLSESLRKAGDVVDYIDYINSRVVRNVGVINYYIGQDVGKEYISNTGNLTTGATVL